AAPRGRPLLSIQSTAGTSKALIISASNTGTTMTSSFFATQSRATTVARMTSKRHAHAAILRTRGSTDPASEASSGFAGIWPAYLPPLRPDGCPKGPSGTRARHDPVTTTTQSELRPAGRATCAVTLKHVSHDAPTRKLDLTRTQAPRGRYWWVRWVILGIVAIVLVAEIALGSYQLAKAWTSLYEANWWWLIASVLAAAASMHSFAQIQRTLLKSAGVHVKQLRSEAAFYAANSLSTTLPGGPVLSATFLFRQQRLWGASTVVASWQLVMSGVLQAV